jgi:branched-chain amino acid transport system substrate-binding protein
MARKKQQKTASHSLPGTEQFTQTDFSRRRFIQTSAGAVAAGVLLGKRAFAAARTIKIGYVSPQTGMLAAFGETDNFVVSEFRKAVRGGIKVGNEVHPVEVLVRDSQSSPNRAAEIASALIKSDKVDLMLAAGTTETVNPVSDQCEINSVPCVSSDAPWQAYFFGRGGKPDKGFEWTYHFFWGTETMSQVLANIFSLLPTNKVVGALWPNDNEGNIFSDRKTGFPPVFEARGFTVFDPGRFQVTTTDFSAQISALKKANAEILTGIIPPPTFTTFWSQAAQQGYKPKIATIGKALLFPSGVNALGERGKHLTVDVWWSRYHPFKSGLTGQTSAKLCDDYEEATKKQWSQPLGFRHALFEVAVDVLKRTKNLDSPASVVEAIRSTKYESMVGPLQWTGTPPNQWTKNPVKNVCTTPEVGGQWVPGKKFMYDLIVVANGTYPAIPVQAPLAAL